MITIAKSDKIRDGGCNGCTRDMKKPFSDIFIVELRYENSGQSNSIRLCIKCMRELVKKAEGALKQ